MPESTFDQTCFCERANDGITVRLFWNPKNLGSEFAVTVNDARTGDNFTLYPENGEAAIQAFHHPFSVQCEALDLSHA